MDQNLNVNIEMRLRQAGLDQLADKLKQTHGDLDKLSQTAASASSGMDTLGSSTLRAVAAFAGVGVGIGAAIAFVKTSVTEFAHLERQLNATAFQMTNLGIDSAKTMPQVRAFLEGLEASGNGLMSETVPAFQRFLGMTRDAAQAMALVKLSSDIAERGQIDLAGATNVLVQATQGRLKGAFNALGLSIRDANEDVMKSSEFFAEVQRQIGGTGDAMDDTQNKIETFTGAWAKLKRTVAEGPLGDIASGFYSVGTAIVNATSKLLEWVELGRKSFAFKHGSFPGTDVNPEVMGPPAPDPALLAFMDKQAEIEAKAEDAKNEKLLKKRIKEAEREAEERRKIMNRLQREEAIEDARYSQERTKAKIEDEIRLLEIKKDLAKDDANEQFRLQLEIDEKKRQLAIATAKQTGRDVQAINDEFALNSLVALQAWFDKVIENAKKKAEEARRLSDQELAYTVSGSARGSAESYAARREQLRREYEDVRKNAKDSAAVEKVYKDKIAALDMEQFQEKQSLYQEQARFVLGNLEAIFGQSKATAIANAVINTWEGATKALAIFGPTPWGFAAMALAIAAGMAQVSNIENTEPGSGTSGAAGMSTRGAHFTPPTSENTPAIGASGVHSGQVQSGGMTVINNFHGTVIDSRRAARDLSRTLTDAIRRDQTRKVS